MRPVGGQAVVYKRPHHSYGLCVQSIDGGVATSHHIIPAAFLGLKRAKPSRSRCHTKVPSFIWSVVVVEPIAVHIPHIRVIWSPTAFLFTMAQPCNI